MCIYSKGNGQLTDMATGQGQAGGWAEIICKLWIFNNKGKLENTDYGN